ncbi:MAG TPA: excinuclease ABC subunit UvrC [Candidatus Onthocola stercorigallinarum]|nr:excinuclease ABC subunit UvrC [Candidatus Onthocola stercorigallinarum]
MFKEKLKTIPHLPGSYQMRNINGNVIYVGKAKDLYKRVNSYFKGTVTGKTAIMVSEVADFTYITTSSEQEAFILELNLIKEYNPKYNILLKDDKSYPYIEYISKPYPRLKVSRYLNIRKKDKKLLFGPYPNAYAARKIVELINRIYPLKKCEGMPKHVCLYYHIGECLGYCEKNVNLDKLKEMEHEILAFLRGNDKILIDNINAKIKAYSDTLNFEMARDLKKELEYISVILDKQKVELHDYINRDVIAAFLDDGLVSVQILFLRSGKIIGGHNDKFYLISDIADELNTYILNFYSKHEIPKEILVENIMNSEILSELLNTKVYNPIKGKKKNLLDMAKTNAKISLEQELKIIERDEARTVDANAKLKEILGLDVLDRIDAFDNSNLFGSYAVSGMVVFINGKPAKNEYRKYKVSVDKNDDYNTMKEVIYRRYYRALVDNLTMPDLILVDGGENQIRAAKEILDALKLNIKVCGLKKDNHHKTSELIDGDTLEVIDLSKNTDVFHYLTRIQDEVHRFTITYHKTLRDKGTIASLLDNIDGIGKVRKKELIKKYGSIKKMSEASIEELSEIIPENVALNLHKYLKERSENKNNASSL